MDQILVSFFLYNSTCAEVKVSKDMIVADALEQIACLCGLEIDNEWYVTFKETNEAIDLDKTMEENGITDGTVLRATQRSLPG